MPAPAEIGPGVWTATFAAVGAGSLVAAALVLAVIALAEGALPSMDTLRMFGADLVVSLTNTSIGLAGATLIAQDWHAGWLIIPPAAVLILAYRAYLSEHTKHQSLEFLYGVARSLSRAPDVETALVDLLERTRESFRVQHGGDHPVRRRRRPAAAHVARRRRRHPDDAARRATRSRRRCARACATSAPSSWIARSRAAGARRLPGRARHRSRPRSRPSPARRAWSA